MKALVGFSVSMCASTALASPAAVAEVQSSLGPAIAAGVMFVALLLKNAKS